jgi:hypothetical protein
MLRHWSAPKTDESYFSAIAAAAQIRIRKNKRFMKSAPSGWRELQLAASASAEVVSGCEKHQV